MPPSVPSQSEASPASPSSPSPSLPFASLSISPAPPPSSLPLKSPLGHRSSKASSLQGVSPNFLIQACSGSEYVSLNVGGKTFVTTRSTLTREEDSMLAMMFKNETMWSSATDKNGAYLIDRTPKYFAPILHYLRTGNVILDPGIDLAAVLEEAKFFGIMSMVEYLEDLQIERDLRSKVDFTRTEFIQVLVQTPRNDQIRCQGLNLEGIDLSCLDLRLINFKMSNLRNAKLRNCNCEYVSFECADLSGADLEGANLSGAIFSRAVLENANMKRCNFENPATGKGADFGGTNLNGVQLEDSILVKANLRVASLRGANLKNCNLRGAVLAGADLKGCNLTGCNLQDANLRGANILHTKFDLASPVHMSMSM